MINITIPTPEVTISKQVNPNLVIFMDLLIFT